MNCLHSCFKNLVFRGRQLVASTPAEDHGMERDWGGNHVGFGTVLNE